MATVPGFENQLLPSAEAGSSMALGAEFSQAVLPQEEAAMQKWNSAIALGKVAQDFSNKIHDARDTKALFDSKLYAEEQYRSLINQMNSPEFAKEHSWQDYGSYFDKEADRIHKEALDRNKGYATPRALENTDLELRGQRTKYKSNSDALARTGEVLELRTDVLNGYNKYKELVVKADAAGDRDGVADYSSQMTAILSSARQARLITANEYESMLDGFNNDVKKVVWQNRIINAASINGQDGEPDYKTRSNQLGLIAQQLNQPLIGFDDVLRTNLRATALHQQQTASRETDKRDYYEITMLNEREKNNLTSVLNGESTEMLPFDDYVKVHGNKNNRAKAEYEQYQYQWETAFAVSQGKDIINNAPIENYAMEIQSMREAGKFTGKSYEFDKAADEMEKQARHNIGMILEDPARFATEVQKVPIDKPATIVAELRRVGVPDKDLSVIPDKIAKQEVSKIKSMTELEASRYIKNELAPKYGGMDNPLFSIAMRDLQKAKLPFAYEFAATSLDPEKDKAFIEELTKANQLTPAKYKSITGLDMESSMTYKALSEFVPQKMAPLIAAYSNPNVSPENTEKAGKILQSAMNLAMYRSLSDLNAAGNASDIADGVADDFISKYNIMYNDPNWIRSGGNSSFAIPKHYNVGKKEIDTIKPVVIQKELPAMLDLFEKRVALEHPDYPPITPEVKAQITKDFLKNGRWYNVGTGSDDLVLRYKDMDIRVNPTQIKRYVDSGVYEKPPAEKKLPEPATKAEPTSSTSSVQPSSTTAGVPDPENPKWVRGVAQKDTTLSAQGGPRVAADKSKSPEQKAKELTANSPIIALGPRRDK